VGADQRQRLMACHHRGSVIAMNVLSASVAAAGGVDGAGRPDAAPRCRHRLGHNAESACDIEHQPNRRGLQKPAQRHHANGFQTIMSQVIQNRHGRPWRRCRRSIIQRARPVLYRLLTNGNLCGNGSISTASKLTCRAIANPAWPTRRVANLGGDQLAEGKMALKQGRGQQPTPYRRSEQADRPVEATTVCPGSAAGMPAARTESSAVVSDVTLAPATTCLKHGRGATDTSPMRTASPAVIA